MTAAQRRALAQLHRLADRLAPRVRYAYRSALDRLQLGGNAEAAIRAIQQGDVDAAVRALLPPKATNVFAHELTAAIANVIADVGPTIAKDVGQIVRVARFQFITGSPAAAEALDRMTLSAVVPVETGAEAGLRAVLRQGLLDGVNPRQLIGQAREFVGLTEYDVSIVQSFELALRGDLPAALERDLRDRRFDAAIRKAVATDTPLTDSQIRDMVTRYAERLHDWRAETWARTTSLQATRETTTATWHQAADDLGIDRQRILKTWVTTLDGRERPAHHALNGDTVPVDQPFRNGDMIPGDGTGVEGVEFNCRCVAVYQLAA